MSLENLPTENGKRVSGIYVVQAKFVEEQGYEPPQGTVEQVFSVGTDTEESDDEKISMTSASQMIISSARWTLSEDPNDRKDSLWYV